MPPSAPASAPPVSETADRGWPDEFARFRWEGADLVRADGSEEDRAGRDSLGTPGRIRTVKRTALVREQRLQAVVRRQLEQAGLRLVRSEADRAEYAEPRPELGPESIDPFLLEQRLTALVKGRSFPGQQRSVIEAKVESLRREIEDRATDAARRRDAEQILHSLEDGLATTVEFRSIVRRFQPTTPVAEPRETIGSVVPVSVGTRLVYRVNSIDSDAGCEGDAEAMVFHIVALGAREACILYTGGVHGFRHVSDLDGGRSHHAWFANREKVRTDATAPWIGRAVYRELRDAGASELIVHRRRDAEPIAVEKVGEDRSYVRIDGRPYEVPVIRCRTSRDDDLVVLADEESPLVLRLVESGADLVRTIDAIVSPPGKPFIFPGDAELKAASARIRGS